MYAITPQGFRAVTADMPLAPGETLVQVLPPELIGRIDADQKRMARVDLLRSTDWTQMADAPLTAVEKLAWGVYRQALRDLPALPGFPDVAWPQPPNLANGTAGETSTIRIP